MSFQLIKDTDQLSEYLQKHVGANEARHGSSVKTKDASPAANDYRGMKQMKAGLNIRKTTVASAGDSQVPLSGRYEKRQRSKQRDLDDIRAHTEADDDDECRSLAAEIDYSRKDATRHIVQRLGGAGGKDSQLRQRLLKNLENVRKNKPLLKSEVGTVNTMRSRVTNASAIASQAAVKGPDGRLSKIEEADGENNAKDGDADATQEPREGEEELEALDEISHGIASESNLRNAQGEELDMGVVDLNAGTNDLDYDEVSCYKGTIMQGIGIAKDGPHYRKLGDELGIQKRRAFETNHHALSKGFEGLAIPSGKEVLVIAAETQLREDQAKAKRDQLSQMSKTFSPGQFGGIDQPAGSRLPKPYKKTYADKLPEWIEKHRQEGMTDADLQDLIKSKAEKYQGKWGNNSRVGILINNYGTSDVSDDEKLKMKPRNQAPRHKMSDALSPTSDMRAERMSSLPALQHRNSAMPSRRTKSISLRAKNQTSVRNSQRDDIGSRNTLDYDHFRTTNQSYHDVLETQDFSAVKKNFKKKTPFTQWSNAYFSGGVFFNPPVSGI